MAPNQSLRAARLRVESPTAPGSPLTRQELAEAVNAHVHRTTGRVTAVDANHVGKWERGRVRWPAACYRAALRAILGVGTDADLGFVRPDRGTDDVDRKTFLRTTLGTGVGAVLGGQLSPAEEHRDLAAVISGPTAHYRRMEQAVPTGELAPAVDAHLRLATGIVGGDLNTPAGYAALAEVAGLAAWLAVDRGDHATARRRYREAVGHAERTHHPLLVAYMTASFGHFAVEAGHARQGVALLDLAATQLDASAPDSARAWLASLHALGHAALGDAAATRAALRSAEQRADRGGGEPRWPWVFAFDGPKLARYQASALARLGDVRAVDTAYQAARPALTGARPRALAQLDRAYALSAAGHHGEGCRLAVEALRVGRAYGSERITARVRDYRATVPARTTEARALDEALAALYDTEAR